MSSKIKTLRQKLAKEGSEISPLLPANWIELKGKFSPSDLRTIANAVKANFDKLNGNTK